MARNKSTENNISANLGYEAKLWLSTDKLHNNMDAAEYKHIVLGLIFLKYSSDTFDMHPAAAKTDGTMQNEKMRAQFAPSSFLLQTSLAWVQHLIYHLYPSGFARFLLANDSTISNQTDYLIIGNPRWLEAHLHGSVYSVGRNRMEL